MPVVQQLEFEENKNAMTEIDQLDTFLDDELDSESFNSYANVQSHMRR